MTRTDALIGDLVQERAAGRSRWWLCRQVVSATATALTRNTFAHPIRATTAVLVACVVRELAMSAWAPYEPSVDAEVGRTLAGVVALSGPLNVVAVSWVNALALTPVWCATGSVVARFSPGAVFAFVAVTAGLVVPGVSLPLHSAIASGAATWLLPALMTMFASSIGAFVFSTLCGAVCGASPAEDRVI